MRNNNGCLGQIIELFLLTTLFDWLQDRFGFGKGASCTGCGCGVILMLMFMFFACTILTGGTVFFGGGGR